jgi:hypothetical protein
MIGTERCYCYCTSRSVVVTRKPHFPCCSRSAGYHFSLPPGPYHLNRLRSGDAYPLREVSRARTQRLVRAASGLRATVAIPPARGTKYQARRRGYHPRFGPLFMCPWQESNPWGSVLRVICNHQAIVQPRLRKVELTSFGIMGPNLGAKPLPLWSGQVRFGVLKALQPGPRFQQIGDGDGGAFGASPIPDKSGTKVPSPPPGKSGTGTGTRRGVRALLLSRCCPLRLALSRPPVAPTASGGCPPRS